MHWFAAHVFYHSDVESVLTQFVAPLVEDLRRRELIEQFFFVRYMEGGPHVRLRFGGEPSVIEGEVRPEVERGLQGYLSDFPSPLTLSREQLRSLGAERTDDGSTPTLPLQPNNSVLYVPYQPETERYGGPAGVPIAERHFDFSSRMALEWLAREPPGEPPAERKASARRRLGMALQVALAFCTGLGWSVRQMVRIFAQCEREMALYLESSTSEIENRFATQRDGLCALARQTLRRGGDPAGFATRWMEHGVEIRKSLVSAGVGGADPAERTATHARIVTSYLHMFNNRVGIFLSGELYLAALVRRTCEALLTADPAGRNAVAATNAPPAVG